MPVAKGLIFRDIILIEENKKGREWMETEILELKKSLVSYLERVENALPDIVSGYRFGNEQQANEQMILLTKGLDWIGEAMDALRGYHSLSIVEIKEFLEELNEAFENGDMVLIADLLEYELSPKVQQWRQILVGDEHVH